MSSTYAQVVAGLNARFATVAALKQVITGEPEAVDFDLPAIYTRLEGRTEGKHSQVSGVHYRSLHRVLVQWQQNAAAEAELAALVDSVPAAVWTDAHLGLTDALVQTFEGEGGFVDIPDGVPYRCIDFYSDVLVK